MVPTRIKVLFIVDVFSNHTIFLEIQNHTHQIFILFFSNLKQYVHKLKTFWKPKTSYQNQIGTFILFPN
jgi:hypothetical protein